MFNRKSTFDHNLLAEIIISNTCTLGPPLTTSKKDAKETARYKWVLVVTKLFNMVVNDFDAKQSARYSRVLVVKRTRS